MPVGPTRAIRPSRPETSSARRKGFVLHKGRTGAARLVLEVGCPIFAVGIAGTDVIQPPGAKAPKPFKRCSITIGRPVRPDRYRREPHLAWRSMIDEVMFEIREITGQECLHHYAGENVDTSTDVPVVARPVSVTDGVRVPTAERGLVGAR